MSRRRRRVPGSSRIVSEIGTVHLLAYYVADGGITGRKQSYHIIDVVTSS